ncbi:HAAS signaling domain-containing protein [Protaetiibacter intestinalis]|uniref:HAAS signaling domain-containing protein n=1 Tax=Protaetiibacter intestinalis TaxID=2419774 RepID=UPI0013006A32|nr:hypothetical protein [Protaetiibacter intestinalis]
MTQTDSYLAALQRELADVDRATRDELVRGIREELDGLGDAEAAERLRELGDPAFVAASARSEARQVVAEPQKQDAAWYSVVTVLLGSIGGFVVPVIGWLVGLVMLWMSSTWQLRHKVVGTLLTLAGPGGLLLFTLPAYTVTEVTVSDASGFGKVPGANPLVPAGATTPWGAIVAAAVLALAWVVGWIWLLVVADRARRR